MVSFTKLVTFAFGSVAAAVPLEDRTIGPTKPTEDDFYKVPEFDVLSKAENGEILRWREVPSPIAAIGIVPLNLQGSYQALYKTTDGYGEDTATVLTIIIPHNADFSKVVSYPIAEDAAFLNCAPSYILQLGSNNKLFGGVVSQSELALMEAALQQGWVVISQDHEGSKSAWLSRENAAHAILDGIRAALNSKDKTGIESDAKVAMWGYSGGAIASIAALEIRKDYAPELNIVGAAAGGPAPDILSTLYTCNRSPYGGIPAGGIMALANAIPEIKDLVDQHVKPEYKAMFEQVKSQCLVANIADFFYRDVIGMFDDFDKIVETSNLTQILNDNNLGGRGVPDVPMFIYKGVFDDVTPVGDTDKLVDYYCDNGATSLSYYRDGTASHGGMAVSGAGRAIGFLHDIMDGKQQVSGCKRQTVFSGYLDFKGSKYLPQYITDFLFDLLGSKVGPY
jgi:hypothetical protein